MQSPQDYYSILGVSHHASDNEIRQAFRALAKALHPDRLGASEGAPGLEFSAVTQAYETLKDAERRRAYDETLTRSHSLVAQSSGVPAKSKAFMAGLSVGLVLALGLIAGKFYFDGPFRLGGGKNQDSLRIASNHIADPSKLETIAKPDEVSPHSAASTEDAKQPPAVVQTEAPLQETSEPPYVTAQTNAADANIDGTAKSPSTAVKEEKAGPGEAIDPKTAEQTLTVAKRNNPDQASSHGDELVSHGQEVAQTSALKVFFSPRQFEAAATKLRPGSAQSSTTPGGRSAELSPAPGSPSSAARAKGDAIASLQTVPPPSSKAAGDQSRYDGPKHVEPSRDSRDAPISGTSPPDANNLPASLPPQSSPGVASDQFGRRREAIAVPAGSYRHEVVLFLKPGNGRAESFTNCPSCPEMVVAPEGQFTMGVKYGGEGFRPDAAPAHTVEIRKPFAVSKYQISNENLKACIQAGACRPAPFSLLLSRPEMPVRRISWADAKAYAAWMSAKTGKHYRLLSEAEWEYLARVGRKGEPEVPPYPGNMRYRRFDSIGFFPFADRFRPAESLVSNRWGLFSSRYDTLEWVDDCWHRSYDRAPADGSAWLEGGGGECNRHVIRGSAVGGETGNNALTARAQDTSDMRSPMLGFRVARDIQAENQSAYENQ